MKEKISAMHWSWCCLLKKEGFPFQFVKGNEAVMIYVEHKFKSFNSMLFIMLSIELNFTKRSRRKKLNNKRYQEES
ncbi:hypothetical protein MKW98_019583 [Papaver atlanticum]|uniref:Uncharacterized protein n=1 Tax=Papaver atlanticum TaxID=357466 RepID=A0AAD4SAC6_9MAGN|nr:hypothetical protein MKW98_019583 [Papaver atlanticum]